MTHPVQALFLRPEDHIRLAMVRLGQTSRRILLMVDADERLLATITDGDIRRAILAGIPLESPVQALMAYKSANYTRPITAAYGSSPAKLQALMAEHDIQQLPLLDESGRVIECIFLEDLLRPASPLKGVKGVVMAGGFGTRLAPLTENLPKPMLPVGGRPLLEHIVKRLERAGIHHINITTHYQAEKIVDHFGDGGAFGVDIQYVAEENPLGTAGALGLLPPQDETLLIINGDILTDLDFGAMLRFHQKQQARLTVGVRQYQMRVPYGVIFGQEGLVTGLEEKPSYSFLVNAGIYLVEPAALALIPPQQFYNMTDLIEALLANKQTVASFPIIEYWLDIGQHGDYQQAQEDFDSGRIS